jgi:RecA/RadA recombinase
MDKKALVALTKLRDNMTKAYGAVATVIGGYPMGRITVVWGPEGCGKTTMAIHGMAEAQKAHPDKLVGYIDMEQTFDWTWAEKPRLAPRRQAHPARLTRTTPRTSPTRSR